MAVTIRETPQTSHKFRRYTIKLHNLHTISTTVTSHPGVARDRIHYSLFINCKNRHRLVVGLGVQWTPHHNPAATIQLCISRRCLIFQLHHSDSSPRILRRILSNHGITFVGLWCHSDARKLLESPHRLEMVRGMPIDLRTHIVSSDGRSLHRASIAEISEEYLGIEIDCWDREIIGRSDWEVDELTYDQVRQATVDAFISFTIGIRCSAWELNTNI